MLGLGGDGRAAPTCEATHAVKSDAEAKDGAAAGSRTLASTEGVPAPYSAAVAASHCELGSQSAIASIASAKG